MNPLLTGLIILIASAGITTLGFLMKKTIIDSINSVKDQITTLYESVHDFKQEVVKDYVTKEDYKINNLSHTAIHEEIKGMRDRISKSEGHIESLKERVNGK